MNLRFALILITACLLGLVVGEYASADEISSSQIIKIPLPTDSTTLRVGLDLMVQDHFHLLGKRQVALIANQDSRTSAGQHLFDMVRAEYKLPLAALIFVAEPENDRPLNLNLSAREFGKDVRLTLLDAENYVLTEEMVNGAELILIDLQDNGWWYSSALWVLIESLKYSARHHLPVILLDRPNPLGGLKVEGPLTRLPNLEPGYLLPVRHGLTLGEMALLVVKEKWIGDGPIKLTVVPMANYRRMDAGGSMLMKSEARRTGGLSRDKAYLWGAMQLVRASNLSCGAGTDWVYEVIGAPWMSATHLVEVLERERLTGVAFYPISFTPRVMAGSSEIPLYLNETCSGVQIRILDFQAFEPIKTVLTVLYLTEQLYPRHFRWRENTRLKSVKDWEDYKAISGYGGDLGAYLATIQAELSPYQRFRVQYLIYP